MKRFLKRTFKVTFWVLAWILFPCATGLYFVWPGKICKDKMSKGWKIFWWILYAFISFGYIVMKLFVCCASYIMLTYEYSGPTIDRDSVSPAVYKTREDFYKLTGVAFPELEMVDSLFYDDGLINYWSEYKFVAKGGANKKFYKRLKNACKTDSSHWTYSEDSSSDYLYKGTGEPIVGDQKIYKYWIYPDKEPVDRSRGMCDRMVELDGEKVVDWDGNFISVEVLNDTIVLRQGWVR